MSEIHSTDIIFFLKTFLEGYLILLGVLSVIEKVLINLKIIQIENSVRNLVYNKFMVFFRTDLFLVYF
jgi:hypothetical protein